MSAEDGERRKASATHVMRRERTSAAMSDTGRPLDLLVADGRSQTRDPGAPTATELARRRRKAAVGAVVAGAVLAAGSAAGELGGGEVKASSTPTTAVPARDAGALQSVDPDGDGATALRVTYEVPSEEWLPWFGAVKYLPGDADGVTGLSITTVTNLVGDGCRDHTPLEPPVGPTVDDLAVALSQLAPFEVTAPPTDVTLFGYRGKHLELTVPSLPVLGGGGAGSSKNTTSFTGCVDGQLHSWISPINDLRVGWPSSPGLLANGTDSESWLGAFNAYQLPGQTEEFWILDVEGTRVVLVSLDTPRAPATDVAERNAIFDTIRIEP